jgi:hypothetical protein
MADLIGDINYSRGDSYPLSIRIKDKASKEYIDITGYTFLLTVDPSKSPEDSTGNIFQVIGVVDPDQVTNKGKVSFTPTQTDTDNVGKYYYDIQFIDGVGNKRTFVRGFRFILGQDITK